MRSIWHCLHIWLQIELDEAHVKTYMWICLYVLCLLLRHKSSYITNNIAVLFFEADWIPEKIQFEIRVQYIGFETDIDFLELAN